MIFKTNYFLTSDDPFKDQGQFCYAPQPSNVTPLKCCIKAHMCVMRKTMFSISFQMKVCQAAIIVNTSGICQSRHHTLLPELCCNKCSSVQHKSKRNDTEGLLFTSTCCAPVRYSICQDPTQMCLQ